MVNVIILAGGNGIGESYAKAFSDINGKPMIQYVIEAFKQVKNIGKIVVVGSQQETPETVKDTVDAVVEGGSNIIHSVMNGIRHFSDNEFVLVSSADIPMITKDAIEDFILKSKESGADFCYPIVDKKINQQKHPDIRRTYIRTKQGEFTGGNIMYINVEAFEKGEDLGQKLFAARKNPFQLASIMGITTVFGLLTGKLSITTLEKKFSKALDIKAKAIISDYSEIGNDVDTEKDLTYVRNYLLLHRS